MVPMDSSIKMGNHAKMVLILLILEDIFPLLTCTDLKQTEDPLCIHKGQLKFMVAGIVKDTGTIITTTGFSIQSVRIKMNMMITHLKTKISMTLKEN